MSSELRKSPQKVQRIKCEYIINQNILLIKTNFLLIKKLNINILKQQKKLNIYVANMKNLNQRIMKIRRLILMKELIMRKFKEILLKRIHLLILMTENLINKRIQNPIN